MPAVDSTAEHVLS